MSDIIAFTKVALPYGWLGNMAPYPVIYEEREYKTTEHLFQCLRYEKYSLWDVVQEIRDQRSPMGAKITAKNYRHLISDYEFLGDGDILNMITCLNLKLDQHPHLKSELIATRGKTIIEDCTKRLQGSGSFWGAGLVDGKWVGKNILGCIWMEIREDLLTSEFYKID